MTVIPERGLSLQPFRALRPAVDDNRLARLLCPPYDVIGPAERDALLAADPDNAVAIILPDESLGDARYAAAAELLQRQVDDGLRRPDDAPAVYVYEMRTPEGALTRGLLGAVELRDPDDGVILPHENTMAGPVSDRLALMAATGTNLEPIYLVYDGGGAASHLVGAVDEGAAIATTTTPDGITHRLWALTDKRDHDAIDDDLRTRRALIADGHHRYATYRKLQRRYREERGAGPWDFGLTLLVDSTSYGPQVHAIHRVLPTLALHKVVEAVRGHLSATPVDSPAEGLDRAAAFDGFALVATDGTNHVLVSSADPQPLIARARRADEPEALAALDVTLIHRVLVEDLLGLADTEANVGYAHDVDEAVAAARDASGTALLLRPTPVDAVAGVAAAGARMPRKSTLFTPKPASGLVMRRFADEH